MPGPYLLFFLLCFVDINYASKNPSHVLANCWGQRRPVTTTTPIPPITVPTDDYGIIDGGGDLDNYDEPETMQRTRQKMRKRNKKQLNKKKLNAKQVTKKNKKN
nr:PREDICTED: uncharacterized protein LOC107398099 [Tribolium castaneum]|eukprot:XP_015836541.1 PREDICTED: uncharacterized protein LOC107398099 [Tribolium castaneum]